MHWLLAFIRVKEKHKPKLPENLRHKIDYFGLDKFNHSIGKMPIEEFALSHFFPLRSLVLLPGFFQGRRAQRGSPICSGFLNCKIQWCSKRQSICRQGRERFTAFMKMKKMQKSREIRLVG